MNSHPRILIVDDEPNVRLVFRTALQSNDYAVSSAEDGETALRWLATDPFDLVLLDLHMPGIDGMETLRRMREAGSEVPVVMITAHGSIPHAVEAMRLGAIDFLAKPLTPEALRGVVSEILARHEVLRPATKPAVAVTVESQFEEDLSRAKRALNGRNFPAAEVFLKQAIALRSDSADAHNLLGILYELQNNHDASYREYKAALKADRHHEPAQNNMRRYYERFTFGKSDVPIDIGERS